MMACSRDTPSTICESVSAVTQTSVLREVPKTTETIFEKKEFEVLGMLCSLALVLSTYMEEAGVSDLYRSQPQEGRHVHTVYSAFSISDSTHTESLKNKWGSAFSFLISNLLETEKSRI